MKKIFLVFILAIACCTQAWAAFDKHTLHSGTVFLLKELDRAKADTVRFSILDTLVLKYEESKEDSFFFYAQQEMLLATHMKNQKYLAMSYKWLGEYEYITGNYPVALEMQLKSLKTYEDLADSVGIANIYRNIGITYKEYGAYDKATEYFLNEKTIAEKCHDYENIELSYLNLGHVYYLINKLDSALIFEKEGYALALKYKSNGMGPMYSTIGAILAKLHKKDSALRYFRKGIEVTERDFGPSRLLCKGYFIMGVFYNQYGPKDSSIHYYHVAISMAKTVPYLKGVSYAARALSVIYDSLHMIDSAFYYQQMFMVANDSLNSSNKKAGVANITVLEAMRQKDAEQFKKDLIATSEKKKQQIVIIGISIGLLLVLVFAGLLFNRFKVTQRQKHIIERQKIIVEEKNKEVFDSITYAKRLQDAILPPMAVIKESLPESFVLYKPKDIVAGDFYWMRQVGDTIIIAACDCTGHGVPGAMVSLVCANALNRTVREFNITEPGKILDRVREAVIETFERSGGEVKDGMDASLCSINTKTGEIKWSGAYNPLWYIQNNEMKEVAPDKQPIGACDNMKVFNTHSLKLQKGDAIYLFTDGYADQFGGPKGKKFKYKQLQDKILSLASISMEKQSEILNETLDNWKGDLEQVDDILIMGIRV